MDHSGIEVIAESQPGQLTNVAVVNSVESQVISGLRLDATAGRVFYTRKYYGQFFEDYSRLIAEALETNNTVAFLSLGLAAPYYDRNCFWAEAYLKTALRVSNCSDCLQEIYNRGLSHFHWPRNPTVD